MIKITCVVDDISKRNSDFWSEHGLSFWIETKHGNVLFDTGQTASVLGHNMALLAVNPQSLSAVALSHAHYDHTGGLAYVLSKNKNLKIYAHSDIFQPRYSLREGEYKSIGMSISPEELSHNGKLILSDKPNEIIPNLWTTGEISARPEPEGRSAHHFIRVDNRWIPDPYMDDLSLVLQTEEGLVVICGCCHAGLLNTLFHVKRTFKSPIIAVLGGTHLVTADDEYIDHVIDVLNNRFEHIRLYPNHCTGKHTYERLSNAFGDRVKAYPAGTSMSFNN